MGNGLNATVVAFRYGTPVTASSPQLIPGSFVFDSATLALYLDTDVARVQVKDPLKLSLTGGTLTGNVNVVNNQGTTVSSIEAETGVISGKFLETTGEIALDHAPSLYAVIENGRIRTRTRAQMLVDLGIVDPESLGALAYKDSASGEYTPVGVVSTPQVTVNYATISVVESILPGDLPSYTVTDQTLSLTSGTQTEASSTDVMRSITSVDVSQPTFTGTTATIVVR